MLKKVYVCVPTLWQFIVTSSSLIISDFKTSEKKKKRRKKNSNKNTLIESPRIFGQIAGTPWPSQADT